MVTNTNKFFQNEKKFIVGEYYETLMVKTPPYNPKVNIEICDEVGNIISGSEKFLGKYVSSRHVGYGDNGTRYDYFINYEGKQVTHYLNYEGTTRYRKVSFMDERLPYVDLAEGVGSNVNLDEKDEHINRYFLNPIMVKEICSFMGPDMES